MQAAPAPTVTFPPPTTISLKEMKQLQAQKDKCLPKTVWRLAGGKWKQIGSVSKTPGDLNVSLFQTDHPSSTVIRQQTSMQVARFANYLDIPETDLELKSAHSTSSWVSESGGTHKRDELEYVVLHVHNATSGHTIFITIQYSHLQDRLRAFAYAVGKLGAPPSQQAHVTPAAAVAATATTQEVRSPKLVVVVDPTVPVAPECDVESIQNLVITQVNELQAQHLLGISKAAYKISSSMRNALKTKSDELIMTF